MCLWDIDLVAALRHEFLHWCYALVLCLVVLCLNWAISLLLSRGLIVRITTTRIFLWLGFWASLAVVSHYIGDEIIKIPFIK